MVNGFLPDTNILVYALKGIEPYASWLTVQIRENKLVISSIVVAEYLSGASDDEVLVLKQITNSTDVLPVNLSVAEVGGNYKKNYSQKTKKVWLSDCLIASTCKVYGVTLATSDRKDFPMKDINILTNFRSIQ